MKSLLEFMTGNLLKLRQEASVTPYQMLKWAGGDLQNYQLKLVGDVQTTKPVGVGDV